MAKFFFQKCPKGKRKLPYSWVLKTILFLKKKKLFAKDIESKTISGNTSFGYWKQVPWWDQLKKMAKNFSTDFLIRQRRRGRNNNFTIKTLDAIINKLVKDWVWKGFMVELMNRMSSYDLRLKFPGKVPYPDILNALSQTT